MDTGLLITILEYLTLALICVIILSLTKCLNKKKLGILMPIVLWTLVIISYTLNIDPTIKIFSLITYRMLNYTGILLAVATSIMALVAVSKEPIVPKKPKPTKEKNTIDIQKEEARLEELKKEKEAQMEYDLLEVRAKQKMVLHPSETKETYDINIKTTNKVKIKESDVPKKVCPKCGNKNVMDAKFCFVCSEPFVKPLKKRTEEPKKTEKTTAKAKTTPKKNTTKKTSTKKTTTKKTTKK